jgi:hypothetical protein
MGHRDRLDVTAGAWTSKYHAWAEPARRFARALRSLPPATLQDAPGGSDSVKVRWIVYKGNRYLSAVNLTPFSATVTIDGREVALAPYDIQTIIDGGTAAPRLEGTASPRYRAFLQDRIGEYEKLYAEVKALNPEAAPPAYLQASARARELLESGREHEADLTLGVGRFGELELRKDVLDRPVLKAPRLSAAPAFSGDLDAWPKEASDLRAETGEFLAGHIFFPNSWTGPADLSARVRLAHDGKNLYVGVEVRDSVIEDPDSAAIHLSKEGYRDWRGESVKFDSTWQIAIPPGADPVQGKSGAFRYTARRTKTGYLFEGSSPLAELGAAPGGAIGFLLHVKDGDGTPNLHNATWACKQEMLVPHRPNFTYWADARNCGKLVLE